jgi:hypothetical protein
MKRERTTKLSDGDELAGYRVLELVGVGGMGRVYRAVQPRLERIVALKVIRPEFAADEAFRARFAREARLAASVDHPAVLPVFEADEIDGVLFIAMRWVAGADLARVLDTEGPLQPVRAVALLAQLGDALDAAHAIGLLHRDIKPANILIEGQRVYLSDFGLARRSLAGPDSVTETAGFVGTFDYAAPEVLDGRAIDARADIYALGCVFYVMLTGSVPHPGDGLLAKLRAQAASPPRAPSDVRRGLPRALDAVVMRALAKDPDLRFGTAGEFAAAAREALQGARHAPEARTRRRSIPGGPLARAVALVTAIVLLAAALATTISLDGAAQRTGRLPAQRHINTQQRRTGPLPECGSMIAGPPRACRLRAGGNAVIADLARVLHMRTMNVDVTGVSVKSALRDSTGAVVNAPPKTRFIVIDAAVTNLTTRRQVFEPANGLLTGRQTALYLVKRDDSFYPPHGPDDADYSVQTPIAVGVTFFPPPLLGLAFTPGESRTGQLVFYYPARELRTRPRAVLTFQEFGEPFGQRWSLGAVRLQL